MAHARPWAAARDLRVALGRLHMVPPQPRAAARLADMVALRATDGDRGADLALVADPIRLASRCDGCHLLAHRRRADGALLDHPRLRWVRRLHLTFRCGLRTFGRWP